MDGSGGGSEPYVKDDEEDRSVLSKGSCPLFLLVWS